MTVDDLTAVWTPLSAFFAVVAGMVYGVLVGLVVTNPTYGSGIAGPVRMGIIAAVFAASGGLMFFALQTLGSYYSHDPLYSRVMSRYGQWLLFSITIGIVTGLLVRRDRARRRRIAHERAMAEIHGGPR